ncbi:MAG: deoxyribose-phosphate aldolase, partial [Chloroflexi bacterium]|nr:deoxyribose-phosphate aldolase [Chloroflexota bacterium]
MNTRRTNHIFQPDGHALICATEHGMITGPDSGIEGMEQTLQQIIAGGVDAVMASFGTATRFAEQLSQVG